MARIVGHLPVEGPEARYRAAQDVTAARHHQATRLPAQGRTVPEVAEVLAFAPRRVTQLAARYDAFGPEALGDGRRRNGKAAGLLTPDLLAASAERVTAPPEDGGLWSGPEVALWMARHLGLAKVHPQRGREALKRIGRPLQAPRPRHPRAATPEQREALKKTWTRRSRGPGRRTPIGRSRSGPRTVGRTASNRLGLRPVRRRVRAPVGQRPVALGRHRSRWLYVVACVQPTSGEAVWYLSTGPPKPFFAALLAAFARQAGAGRDRHIVLVLDDAGWHGPEGLVAQDGIGLVFLPPCSPELQPAEHLWPLVDEPVVNRRFATLADLEAVVAERCGRPEAAAIKPHIDFRRWPRPATRN
jgi:hypothetical protein